MIEIAQQTAKTCKEKGDVRGYPPIKPFDAAGRSRLSVLYGYGRFAWQQRCKLLKDIGLPAILRLVSR